MSQEICNPGEGRRSTEGLQELTEEHEQSLQGWGKVPRGCCEKGGWKEL